MILQEPNQTPFDLRWRMLGTDIRVHPFFWILALFLGWNRMPGQDGPTKMLYLALWVACVFVSVLLHEFGHVLMGRLFGSNGHIVLHSFGGLAIGSNDLPYRWQRILVSLAGPGIQFVLLGLVLLLYFLPILLPQFPQWGRTPAMVLLMLIEINLVWPILNLLPIWPLDGGQITREVCEGVMPRQGAFVALGISALLAAVLAVHCLLVEYDRYLIYYLSDFGGIYMAIFFGLFCVQSVQMMQYESARRRRYDDDQDFPWER